MELIDISRGLSTELASWPGDTPFRFALKWKMSERTSVNVGVVEMSVHNGTHVDAPFHFQRDGKTIGALALDVFIGPATVVDLTEISSPNMREITVRDLELSADALREAPRLLLKTGAWPKSEVFPKTIPVIAPDVPRWLRAKGVRLLGLDLPSVDPIDSKDLANHHALAAADIAILESLDLSNVLAGIYRFAALPLKILGADAAPVRAILWKE